jgi:SAM-dependent methyltransferase
MWPMSPPEGWTWDETLFAGAAAHYLRGRLPYPDALHDVFRASTRLDGSPRLIDVGCGPGVVALALADLFAEVVGVDPDAAMLAEAERLAAARGIAHAAWVKLRAEELPAGLGSFRYATFAQSFHWMDRERVARLVFDMLEPGGAFVHVNTVVANAPPVPRMPYPPPPDAAIQRLATVYLGPVRRAGQGQLRHGTPGDEWGVLRRAGYLPPRVATVPGRRMLEAGVDDIVASVFSASGTAPHLFGDRLPAFEAELRGLLQAASDHGRFSRWLGDIQLDIYERP